MKYTQLTMKERYYIELLIQEGHSQKMISEFTGRHKSTINREIKRNKGSNGLYVADEAINLARKRRERTIDVKLTPEHEDFIRDKLELSWSPEQIAGYIKRTKELVSISHELIYQHIDRDRKEGGSLYKYLPHRGDKYKKRNIKTRRVWKTAVKRKLISERPHKVLLKKEIGHWEGDTVESKGHRGGIGTFVDMKSRFVIIRKLRDKSSEEMKNVLLNTFSNCPELIKTLTVDNGNEFALHNKISHEIGVGVYFANPYSPWERGLNENTNGLIRRFYPKGTDFNRIPDYELVKTQNQLNERPRKVLGFRSPMEVFTEELLKKEKFRAMLNVC
jgi:IS30 family transposase